MWSRSSVEYMRAAATLQLVTGGDSPRSSLASPRPTRRSATPTGSPSPRRTTPTSRSSACNAEPRCRTGSTAARWGTCSRSTGRRKLASAAQYVQDATAVDTEEVNRLTTIAQQRGRRARGARTGRAGARPATAAAHADARCPDRAGPERPDGARRARGSPHDGRRPADRRAARRVVPVDRRLKPSLDGTTTVANLAKMYVGEGSAEARTQRPRVRPVDPRDRFVQRGTQEQLRRHRHLRRAAPGHGYGVPDTT